MIFYDIDGKGLPAPGSLASLVWDLPDSRSPFAVRGQEERDGRAPQPAARAGSTAGRGAFLPSTWFLQPVWDALFEAL